MKVNYHELKSRNVADFLIITVTDRETDKFIPFLKSVSNDGLIETENGGRFYTIGKLGQYVILHCKCTDQGTQEKGSIILTAKNALIDWPCVKAVIMVGVAFGMYEEDVENRQHYSDVLVSSSVLPYERQKLKNGVKEYRGEWHDANETLVNAFVQLSKTWSIKNLFGESVRIEVCKILSGEKLFDDKLERDVLKGKFPEARGGEMESIGLAAACNDEKIPWIMLKGICDFGDGNKNEKKHEKQDDAASCACTALESLLFREDLLSSLIGKEKSNFYFYSESEFEEIVLFDDYTTECEPFYYKREIDNVIQRSSQLKGCWVYGRSGVGKTVALTRALENLGVKYHLVDLATFVDQPIENMFRYIYEEVCDKFGIEPDLDVIELHDLSKAIREVIDNHMNGGDFYLMIEEIPLSIDEGKDFSDFVRQFCALVISKQIRNCKTNVKFMLSSIASPVSFISDSQQKVKTYINFVEVPEWTTEDCEELWDIINKGIKFDIEDFELTDFFNMRENSPREIKNCLRDLYLLKINKVSPSTIASL